MKRVVDRRVARTKSMLEQAHRSLILRKGYDATTVEDICEAANVGRSTFYTHYRSKDELKRAGLEHLRKQLLTGQQEVLAASAHHKDRLLAFSLTMFKHAREHLDLYRALVGSRGRVIALTAIREMLCDWVRAELAHGAATQQADTVTREFAVQHTVGAYMAVLTWWLDRGAKLPPEQMDALFRRFALPALLPMIAGPT
jgi:AcrR family transcriptional regulator